MNYPLIEMAVADFPPAFVSMVVEGMSRVYRESKAKIFEDPQYGDSEKRYLLPHTRRAHTEKFLREAAEKSAIKTSIERATSGPHEYTFLQVGRFSVTACYVDCPNRFPRVAAHRMQHAEINKYLPQMSLELEDSNIIQLPSGGDIYAILIHGSREAYDDSPSFLRLAVPKHNRAIWADAIDLIEIAEIQAVRYQKPAEDTQFEQQDVQPKFKQTRKKEDEK